MYVRPRIGGTQAAPVPMSTDSSDSSNVPVGNRRRYGELVIDSGECIIYDRKNHRAWIQSTVATSITKCD